MLIIVSREHEGLYHGVKARQEAKGRDRVILDRRNGERRRAGTGAWTGERRSSNRRRPLSDAEHALMNVLGFTVLHRELQVVPGERRPPTPAAARRGAKRAATQARKPARRRVAS